MGRLDHGQPVALTVGRIVRFQTVSMESQREIAFVLYVDGKPTSSKDTLSAAQSDAEQYMPSKKKLQILCHGTPAPTRIWTHNYEINQWVFTR
jgi:hypothetical protein